MSTEEPGPDDLVTQPAEVLGTGHRTDLYVGPLADPDRYELLGPPLQGGEGTTWRARYRGDLDQPVQTAIKVLHRPSGAGDAWPTPALMRAWRDRVELLHSAAVPHVVRLHDVEIGCEPHRLGTPDTPRTVLVRMEWVEGETLAAAVGGQAATAATLPRRLDWLDDLCTALAGLHALGNSAVHRDVTPANCIVTGARGLVLIDLSTMQLPHDGADLQGRYTPLYSAPEVIADPTAPRNASADRWAVGAMAFFCLTGAHPPREAAERDARLRAVAASLRSPAAAGAVLELLAEDPADRPSDLASWSARLRATLPAPRRSRGARVLVPIGIAVAALLLAAAVLPTALRPDASTARPVPTRTATATPVPTGGVAPNGARATVDFPAKDAAVGVCVTTHGTASLPADTTIVLVQRLAEGGSLGDPYVEWPTLADTPSGETTFTGVQYFNAATGGQHLRLEVVAVDREAAKRQLAADEPETDYAGDVALVKTGFLLDSVVVDHSLTDTDASICPAS